MKVTELVQNCKDRKISNSKVNEHAVESYIKENVNFKTYLPFAEKREICAKIVDSNIETVHGYVTISSINQFLSFVMAMLVAYTDLEIEDPYKAYDELSETHLLQPIIDGFREEYDACEAILNMELADRMQTNNTAAVVASFLYGISESIKDKFDAGEILKNIGGV